MSFSDEAAEQKPFEATPRCPRDGAEVRIPDAKHGYYWCDSCHQSWLSEHVFENEYFEESVDPDRRPFGVGDYVQTRRGELRRFDAIDPLRKVRTDG